MPFLYVNVFPALCLLHPCFVCIGLVIIHILCILCPLNPIINLMSMSMLFIFYEIIEILEKVGIKLNLHEVEIPEEFML